MNFSLPSSRHRLGFLRPVSLGLGAALISSAAHSDPAIAPAPAPEPDIHAVKSAAASVSSTASASSAVAPRATAPLGQERVVSLGKTVSSSATAPSATALQATIALVSASPRDQLLRLAQNQTTPVPRTQGDANAPAAAPQEKPRGLEVPVGPATTPPDGAPGAPPANTNPTTPPVLAPPTPQLPPDVPRLIGNVAGAEGTEIVDVKVVGNRVIPVETILAQVRTQRGAAFSSRQAELDGSRIDQLGFFATVQAQVTPDVNEPNKTVVTFIVVENRVVNAFKFVGATAVKETDLLPVVTSKLGVVLNRNTIDLDTKAIEKVYAEKGFVVLVKDVNLEPATGTLVFTLQEGRVSRIELSGLKRTRPSLIRRQVRVKSQDPFNVALIQRDLNRIYDLGFFEDATYKVDNDETQPGTLIVTYLLKEKRTGQLSFGVGFDSRSKISGFASLQQNNLGGTGKRALASLETGSRKNFELSFGDPFIGEKNASYDISAYTRSIFREPRIVANLTGTDQTDTNTVSYEEQRTGGRINFTKPLDYDRNSTLLFGYRNERARLFQTDSNGNQVPVLNLRSSGTISAFSTGFLRDKRDLRLDPSSGSRQQFIIEQGTSFLGGDTNFTKLDIDLRQYFPLLRGLKPNSQPRLVLAGRLVLGKSLNQLPAFEQYYVGGTDTVRGYEADEQFGDNQYYGNLELRFRLQSKVQFVLFTDAGRAYGGNFASNISANNGSAAATGTLFSVGAGVRLVTPIGPVRLDVGRGSRGFKTHFGIGPTF